MKHILVFALLGCLVFSSSALSQAAPSPTIPQFFISLAQGSLGDADKQKTGGRLAQELFEAPASEVKAVLPEIFAQLSPPPDRKNYAFTFIAMVAIRPDREDLLADYCDRLATLMSDPDEKVQRSALSVLFPLEVVHPNAFVPTLKRVLRNPTLSQDTAEGIATSFLRIAPEDPDAIAMVVKFMQRTDLTEHIRIQTLIDASRWLQPDEVTREVVRSLDDPSAGVRARAVQAVSRSTKPLTKTLAHQRIEFMALDPDENETVRQWAKEALLGETVTDANVNTPPAETRRSPGSQR